MAANPTDIFHLLDDQIQAPIRRKTIEVISALDIESCIPILTHDNFAVLNRLLAIFRNSSSKEEIDTILRLLINATSASSEISSKILIDGDFIRWLWLEFTGGSDGESDMVRRILSAMVLSNLSIREDGCRKVLDTVPSSGNGGIVEAIVRVTKAIAKKIDSAVDGQKTDHQSKDRSISDAKDDLSIDRKELRLYAAYILRNLTQLPDVRRILVSESISDDKQNWDRDVGLFMVLPILTRSHDNLKFAVADIVRNCCFDTDLHETMVSFGTDDFISAVLYPLVGGEHLTDDENDALPIDLQYMDAEKQREPSAVLRLKLLEAVYQLCATSKSREYLRNKGAYYVLREYHKWEQNLLTRSDAEAAQAELVCTNIIGVLIRTEEEIGCDNLKLLEENRSIDYNN